MSETLSAIMSTTRRGRDQPALFVGLAGEAPRTPPARISLTGCDRLQIGRGATRAISRDGEATTIALADARLSGQHLRLSRVGAAWIVEDLQSKNGTWINGRQTTRHPLADGDVIVVGHTAIVYRDRGGDGPDLDGMPPAPAPGLATLSARLVADFAAVATAARSRAPIEISGESGTGKELAAAAVHALSGRPGRFVAINCGAVPASLLEGELFGHRKGAYTGAVEDRVGLVRSADGGTLFLDEVAELTPTSQVALLRVLQEGEVMPIGGDKAIKVDLRIVTSTHETLDAEVTAKRFRPDLRARVLGLQITLPPLRERREDLGLLVATLLERLGAPDNVSFSADAVMAIYAYAWPLNIRELEHALVTALAVARGRIELEHLPVVVREALDAEPASPDAGELRAVLARHDGNISAVARELGKDRTQVRRWMKRFGISHDE